MANRRKKGREISGWLCLDKGIGQTSTQAVAAIKRLFDAIGDLVVTGPTRTNVNDYRAILIL